MAASRNAASCPFRREQILMAAGGQDLPAGGHEEGTAAITESERILRSLHCQSASLPTMRAY